MTQQLTSPSRADRRDPHSPDAGDAFIVTAASTGRLQIRPDAERCKGLLAPWTGRALRYLAALMQGASASRARAYAHIGPDLERRWLSQDSDFAQAAREASDIGLAIYEAELDDRALAGPDDKGSMRALELKLKSQSALYRDKGQVELTVQVAAAEARARLTGGWRQRAPETDVPREDET